VATTPEELALDLSQATFDAQRQTEIKLRDRATGVLSAASIVVPVAAVAVGKGPAGAAIMFIVAAVAYVFCARFCAKTLFPKNFATGIEGGTFLAEAAEAGASLRQMQATAAVYLDTMHEGNLPTLERAAADVKTAIEWLMVEIGALAVALAITIAR